jgi:hypothetical protein
MRRTFKQIKREVCGEFEIPVEDFDSDKRTKKITLARQKAWFVGRNETGLGWAQLGRLSGGKDHASVHYGYFRWAWMHGKPVPPMMEKRMGKLKDATKWLNRYSLPAVSERALLSS